MDVSAAGELLDALNALVTLVQSWPREATRGGNQLLCRPPRGEKRSEFLLRDGRVAGLAPRAGVEIPRFQPIAWRPMTLGMTELAQICTDGGQIFVMQDEWLERMRHFLAMVEALAGGVERTSDEIPDLHRTRALFPSEVGVKLGLGVNTKDGRKSAGKAIRNRIRAGKLAAVKASSRKLYFDRREVGDI